MVQKGVEPEPAPAPRKRASAADASKQKRGRPGKQRQKNTPEPEPEAGEERPAGSAGVGLFASAFSRPSVPPLQPSLRGLFANRSQPSPTASQPSVPESAPQTPTHRRIVSLADHFSQVQIAGSPSQQSVRLADAFSGSPSQQPVRLADAFSASQASNPTPHSSGLSPPPLSSLFSYPAVLAQGEDSASLRPAGAKKKPQKSVATRNRRVPPAK